MAAVGGAWERAEQELERATDELGAFNAVPPQADGFYAIGDIRRLRGDFEGAEAALREAHARGRSPQPALALVRLAEGKIKAAAAAINGAVAEETWDRWARARLLPAQVEIAIAAGEVGRARTAIDELEAIVTGYPSPALEAGRQVALGRVLVAEGDAAAAARELRAGDPRLARGRCAVRGRPCAGRPGPRRFGPSTTRTTATWSCRPRSMSSAASGPGSMSRPPNASCGTPRTAARDPRRPTRRSCSPTSSARRTSRRPSATRRGSDSCAGTTTVLRNLIASGGGEIVNSTGDGFFAAFESAQSGVDCASSIQRALADHRDSTGFALSVRIGLHTAEANRRGSDYSGKSVHVAARVAALAGGGEILATAETLSEAGSVRASEARSTPIRGVGVPMQVATVIWE